MITQLNKKEKAFTLKLSDGKMWEFSGTKEIIPWLELFAKIMNLHTNSELIPDRKILFLALKSSNRPPHCPENKWKEYKQGAAYRMWSHSKIPESFVELNKNFIDHEEIKYINMWSSIKLLFKYYVYNNGAPIHSTLAEYKGNGILIAAAGGTGKSTCYNRLPDYWNPLSDDNALIIKTKNNYRIHPMPTWSDHLWNKKFSQFNTSHSVPLKAVFFLEQSGKDKVEILHKTDSIRKILTSMKEVWESFWEKCPKEESLEMKKLLFETSYRITEQVPCYTLKATLHGEFWKEIEKIM